MKRPSKCRCRNLGTSTEAVGICPFVSRKIGLVGCDVRVKILDLFYGNRAPQRSLAAKTWKLVFLNLVRRDVGAFGAVLG